MAPPPDRARVLLGVLSLFALAAGFREDAWGVTRPGWFERFQLGTECHVLGRLVKSRQDGLLSAAGLLGVGTAGLDAQAERPRYGVRFRRADLATGIHMRGEGDWPGAEQMDEQFEAYRDGRGFEIYSPYLSQSGGQGWLFGVLDAALPLGSDTRLSIFYGLTSVLSAAALTAIVLWLSAELSVGVAAWVALTALLSQWLIGFGGKLWWSTWAFYVPFLVLLRHERAVRPGLGGNAAAFAAAYLAVLAKCLANGFEYITTALVMMAVPSVYYAVRDDAGVRAWLSRVACLAVAAVAAVATSLGLLVAQLAALRGSFRFGLRHVAFSLAVRTDGALEDFPPAYAASLGASHWSVLLTYLRAAYFDFRGRWPALDARVPEPMLAPSYGQLLVVFVAASALLAWLVRGDARDGRRHQALLAATWFSLLAPLSWLVVFKAHSYEHTHMNAVVWQMPFSLFGFAVCGAAAARLAGRLRGRDAAVSAPAATSPSTGA